MKSKSLSILALLLVSAATLHAHQGKLTPTNITAPTFDGALVEITPASLQRMEASLKDDPEFAAALKNYRAEQKAYREAARAWTQCKDEVKAALAPEYAEVEKNTKASSATNRAAIVDREKRIRELGNQAREAKTTEEKMKLVEEIRALAAGTPTNPGVQQAEQVHQKHQQQLAAKCGAEPVKPATKEPANKNEWSGLAHIHMVDRVAMFCHVGPAEIGADGSVGMDRELYWDASGTDHRIFRFSKAEAAVLRAECARLGPFLIDKGHKWN